MQQAVEELCAWLETTFGKGPEVALGLVVASILIGLFLHHVVIRGTLHLLSRTKTGADDLIVSALRRPIIISVVLTGLYLAVNLAGAPDHVVGPAGRALLTAGLMIWTVLGMRIGGILLVHASQLSDRFTMIEKRTVPLFANLVTVFVLALATYLFLLIWDVDATGWLASAGIVGVAVGFAAKDTLSNLFAGVFIVADAPYQLGDYIVLEDGVRGEVVHIGLRSTRVRTRDDVLITIPNSVIGSSRIVNQSGGGTTAMRVRVPVGVGYGSDIAQVRGILEDIAGHQQNALQNPAPRVRFRRLGDSSLDFELQLWVPEPALRGRVVDAVLTEVVTRFREEDIEIPFPHRDVHLVREAAE